MTTTARSILTRPPFYAICGIIVIGGLIAAIAVAAAGSTQASAPGQPQTPAQVVRDDSHVLDVAEDGRATLVEFLDFECEACGAFYPFVEQLRERYDGRITFVVRYFPIQSHRNSENAAIAAEAASEQGRFEAMYSRLFDTQTQWGEKQESQASLFRTFAEELGLDMTKFDAAVADPATRQRVQRDFQEGLELGVEGTPTFFLNGEKLQPESAQDFYDAIDRALEG